MGADFKSSENGSSLHPFQRLQATLADLIAQTPTGERLPAEPELAKQLGVSRATLREAMRSFEGQGLIRRRQGVGTFVVSQARVIDTGLEMLESIEAMARKINLSVSMGDLRVDQVKADQHQAERLRVPVDTPLVCITRVILTENRPVAYLVDLLPEKMLTAEELQCGFTGSVLDLILSRGWPALSTSLTEIRAVAASSSVARALEIQRGDVLLVFVATLQAADGKNVAYSHAYFLPGYFRFHVVRRVPDTVHTSYQG